MLVQKTITTSTPSREVLVDVTKQVEAVISEAVAASGGSLSCGFCSVYVQGATAGIMIQENWDDSVQTDVVNLMAKIAPRGIWLHDQQDGNGDSHLKAGLVGPSETIPIIDGKLGLSTWQNIFLCEFDGPRRERSIVVTVYGG